MPSGDPYGQHNGRHAEEDRSRMRGQGEHDSHGESAGGRSEHYARQRDAEQLRAGYSRGDWQRDERGDWPRNTRSEPAWDPQRGPARAYPGAWQEDRYDGSRSDDRNGFRHTGHDIGHDPSARAIPRAGWHPGADEHRTSGGWRDERGSGAHHLQDAGRRLVGKVRRLVRNPKNYKRSDERIREDVCDRLSVSDEVDPVEIEVSVENGEVTLKGTVQERSMKFAAEEIADSVPGVHDVVNQLRVRR